MLEKKKWTGQRKETLSMIDVKLSWQKITLEPGVRDTCTSSTWEAEVGGSGIGLHKEFEASLGYLSTYLKK